ncbi:BREX system P-loop protein BrxC [Burkholderia ambifaria]|uniref:BREX system P-loop protein BrxC n=1 Tax=Burkholderia ambifaria TaxID=152480 RepID=UPI00158AEABE|nr:BREX system P-loop protein BrxC [Burkholderia ambifaria]
MNIKQLFDPSRDIYRSIEKVIAYGVSQGERLKKEVSEYVVTDSIDEQFNKLLLRMQAAMDAGGENEVGVWVSGFYGSGKSSFTKYLGLAFDDRIQIDGVPFRQHLQDRLKRTTTRQLLSTVAKRFPAAVLLLDLASEQLAGATMEEVSTVLFYKVLQWAGYSRNLKVAALERKLRRESRYDEFLKLFEEATGGEPWSQYRDDELVVDSLVPTIAHQLYPTLFKTESSFTTETSDVVVFENDRVKEMLAIAREASGKDYIIFIIDEVGQYVGSRQNLILNLDGLSKNLKALGGGKVWIIGTAQQTLTEDDPRAALNSPQLFKLKDRFPIQIDLEANDIKEICFTRLLGKSPEGAQVLGALFDQHGQALRHHTKLEDARAFGADFDRKTFVDLYPFLPAHFDILLHLLGALARSTGGIGLRSAIKVIQDILIESDCGRTAVADQAVGWLATTSTLFDALEKDIQRAFPNLYKPVQDVCRNRFADSLLHHQVAKTVAILQILGNLPVTRQNVAGLMHDGVSLANRAEDVNRAIEELITDRFVPFGEQDGQLRFFSEKLNNVEQERSQIPLRAVELKRLANAALTEVYAPLPSAQLNGSLAVQTGLKAQSAGGLPTSLAGDRNTIQTLVELCDPKEYEATRTRLQDESRQASSKYQVYLIGRTTPEIEELAADIFRCRDIANKHRNDPDQEVKDYCNGQLDRAGRLEGELQRLIRRSLVQGSYIFRGQVSAVESLAPDLLDAARKHLAGVAEQVFDRYAEAPVRVSTDTAERFLRSGNLAAITSQIDPLSLVQVKAGKPSVKVDHKALVSVRDTIERTSPIDGKSLSERFADAPFGWSPDTLRYLVAALLVAGEVKLKVAGREVTVNGQQAVDALKTNNSFKNVGLSLREDKPSMEMLALAADRLTELSGELVVPLEDDISKATVRLFPSLQNRYAPLAEKLRSLGLTGEDRLDTLSHEIADVLLTDASDAPQRLGKAESPLYASLKWAAELRQSLDQGLEVTLRGLQDLRILVDGLPNTGEPAALKADLVEPFGQLDAHLARVDFYRAAADLNSRLTSLRARVREAALTLQATQTERLKQAAADVQRVPEWGELTQQEQQELLASLEGLAIQASPDAQGLRTLVNQDFVIQTQAQDAKAHIERLGRERVQARMKAETEIKAGDAGARDEPKPAVQRKVKTRGHITTLADLDALIKELQRVRSELSYAHAFELDLKLED